MLRNILKIIRIQFDQFVPENSLKWFAAPCRTLHHERTPPQLMPKVEPDRLPPV